MNEIEQPKKNSLKDLIAFFGTVDRPVSPAEFRDFWQSLDQAGKDYFTYAQI